MPARPFRPLRWLPLLLAALLFAPAWAQSADDDALTHAIAAEFALQAGKLDEATQGYLAAARAEPDDAELAARATRIALLAGDTRSAAEALHLWRQREDVNPAMRASAATLALRQDNLRSARRELVALLRMPGNEGWRLALSVLATGSRSPAQSARVLEQLVRAGEIPDALQPWLAFGGLAQRLDNKPLMLRIVDEVVRRFPGEPRVALLRASQLRESGDKQGARDVLQSLQEPARLSPTLRLMLAQEYDALGELREAERLLAQGPQDEHMYRLRASLLARAEDNEALLALYREVEQGAGDADPDRRMLLGQLSEYLKRHEEAVVWYRSVGIGPMRTQARLRTAVALHALERGDEAFAELHQIQADAGIEDDERRDAYLLEADLLGKDASRGQAEIDALARGLAAFPDEPALLYARGLAWEKRDDIPRAEADLRRILVADPENVAALNALGYTLADRTTRYQEALELIDRARVAEPDNAAIIDSHGWVLYRLGRYTEALAELRRAFALMKDAEVAAHIAEVLWTMGRKDEARQWFDTARELDPDHRALQRALEATGA